MYFHIFSTIFSNVFSYISKSIFRSSKALRRGVKLKRRKAYYSRPKRDVSVCYFKDTVIVQIKDIVIVLFKDVHEPVLLAYFFFFFWIMLCRDLLVFLKVIILWMSFQWKPIIRHLTQSYMDNCMIDLKQRQNNYNQKLRVFT